MSNVQPHTKAPSYSVSFTRQFFVVRLCLIFVALVKHRQIERIEEAWSNL